MRWEIPNPFYPFLTQARDSLFLIKGFHRLTKLGTIWSSRGGGYLTWFMPPCLVWPPYKQAYICQGLRYPASVEQRKCFCLLGRKARLYLHEHHYQQINILRFLGWHPKNLRTSSWLGEQRGSDSLHIIFHIEAHAYTERSSRAVQERETKEKQEQSCKRKHTPRSQSPIYKGELSPRHGRTVTL